MESEVYFSVIIPMYNQERYIARCLDSIVTQSMFHNTEVIVVDDGSKDKGAEIVKNYIKIYGSNIKIIEQQNKGLGGARNTGAKFSVGKYIWFVDSDDTIHKEALSELFKATSKDEPEIVLFDIDEVDGNGAILIHAATYTDGCEDEIFSVQSHKDVLGSIHSASNRLMLRNFYQKVQIMFPDRLYFEDLMTIPKILSKAKKILYIRHSYYNYYQNEGSILHNSNVEKYRDILAVMDSLVDFFKVEGLFEIYKQELEYLIIFHAYLMVSARIIKQNYKSSSLGEIRTFIKAQYPHYHRNPYIKRLSLKYKLSLRLIDYRMYFPIYYILNVRKQGNA